MKLLCRLGGEEKNENLVSTGCLVISVKLPPFKRLSVFFVCTIALAGKASATGPRRLHNNHVT